MNVGRNCIPIRIRSVMASGIHIHTGTAVDSGVRMMGKQSIALSKKINPRINIIIKCFVLLECLFVFILCSVQFLSIPALQGICRLSIMVLQNPGENGGQHASACPRRAVKQELPGIRGDRKRFQTRSEFVADASLIGNTLPSS